MRTTNQLTQSELEAWNRFCLAQGIVNDGSSDGVQNANLVWEYFSQTWNQDITERNLNLAFKELKPHLKFYSKAALDYFDVANQEPDRANQLANWLATQGNRGQLVNSGDDAYENLRLLLTELRGREISRKTIADAEGRLSYKPGRRRLHYVPLPKQPNPRQHQDDGEGFLGKHVNLSRADHARLAREAADKNNPQQTPETILSAEDQTWRKLAQELLSYGTHGQQATIKKTFDQAVTSGASWRQVFEACNSIVSQYKRAAAIGAVR